jgi:hypothetical protein
MMATDVQNQGTLIWRKSKMPVKSFGFLFRLGILVVQAIQNQCGFPAQLQNCICTNH